MRTAAEWGWLGRYAPDSSRPLGKHGSGGAVRSERGRVPGRESATWSLPPWATCRSSSSVRAIRGLTSRPGLRRKHVRWGTPGPYPRHIFR